MQEKTMRPIPKNVRQIGERDEEIKLYIEDYVNTFIRKCARADRLVIGALIGDYYRFEGKEYLFVEGAVQADGYTVDDGRVRMTDESWSGLYGKISEFFSGRTVCGWFICGDDAQACSEGTIRSFMYENIRQDKRALIVHNAEAEEEIFSVYDQNVIREQQGYYLFYERNEAMQSYMVTTAFAARTDPVAVDAVTAHVRTRMVERKELPVQKSGSPLVSAAALVVGIIALASGIVMMNQYEKLREMETALTSLSGNLLNFPDKSGEDSTEETGPKFAGLIIEDVAGNVEPTENETETSGESAATGEDGQPVSGEGTAGGQSTSGEGSAGGGQSAPGEGSAGGQSASGEGNAGGGQSASGEGSAGGQSTSGEGSAGGQSASGDGSAGGGQPASGDGTAGGGQSASGDGNGGAGQSVSGENQGGQGSASGQSGAVGESQAGEAGAKEYRSYLVEPGDTLVNICWKIYGYRDDAIIQEICEVNRLSDKDHIYAGQELLIP